MAKNIIAISSLSSASAKILSISLSILSVPLLLNYLGNDRFGLWSVIGSIPSLLVFMDFGIGNGVLNSVANANARGDRDQIRKSIGSGAFILSICALIFFLIFACVWPWMNWVSLLGVDSSTNLSDETDYSILVIGVVFFLSIPSSLAQRLLLGLQKGYLFGIWQSIGAIASFCSIYLVVKMDFGVPGALFATFGVPSVIAGLSIFWLLNNNRDLFPKISDVDKGLVSKLISQGSVFFALQLSSALAFSTDQLVVSKIIGLEAVAEFSVHQKLISPIPIAMSFVLAPLWAAYAHANAQKDSQWIIRSLVRSVSIAFIGASTFGGLIFAYSENLIKIWMGDSINVNAMLIVSMASWVAVDSAGKCIAMFLNGVGILFAQLYIVLLFVPICLFAKVYFTKIYGLPGLPIAICLSYIIVHVPAYAIIIRKWMLSNGVIK